jgi:hypothetical protein
MKVIIKPLFIISTIFLTSCSLTRKEPILKEGGEVVGKQFTPDTRQTVMGTGFSSNGDIVITSHNIGDSEKYTVVFKCEHGVIFNINNPDLYAKLKEGDSVIIDYYELVNKKGEVKDLEFIDANPTN